MPLHDSEQRIRDHFDGNPEARHAALHDPEYAAEVHRLRAVLEHLDESLTAEGLPDEARQRVGTRLVTAWLGTDESSARVRNVRQHLTQDKVRIPAEFL